MQKIHRRKLLGKYFTLEFNYSSQYSKILRKFEFRTWGTIYGRKPWVAWIVISITLFYKNCTFYIH